MSIACYLIIWYYILLYMSKTFGNFIAFRPVNIVLRAYFFIVCITIFTIIYTMLCSNGKFLKYLYLLHLTLLKLLQEYILLNYHSFKKIPHAFEIKVWCLETLFLLSYLYYIIIISLLERKKYINNILYIEKKIKVFCKKRVMCDISCQSWVCYNSKVWWKAWGLKIL